MNEIATHIRIHDPSPSDDLVEKRGLAVKDISNRYVKKGQTVEQLLDIADNIGAAAIDIASVESGFAAEIEKLVNDHSPSFVRSGHDPEFLTAILLGANQLYAAARPVGSVITSNDVVAAGVWSALSFQSPRKEAKIEALRASVIERTRSSAMAAGEMARARVAVPDVTFKLAENADVSAASTSVKNATQATIGALRQNAILDREEINILWWALSDFSRFLNAPFAKQPELSGAIVAALELAPMLKRLPAEAHRHLVLRHLAGKGAKKFSAAEVIEALGEHREAIAVAYRPKTTIEACPYVFPLLNAILDGESDDDAKLSVADWGARALLEGALVHLPNMTSGQ